MAVTEDTAGWDTRPRLHSASKLAPTGVLPVHLPFDVHNLRSGSLRPFLADTLHTVAMISVDRHADRPVSTDDARRAGIPPKA